MSAFAECSHLVFVLLLLVFGEQILKLISVTIFRDRIAMLNAMLPLLNQLQMTYSDLSSGFLDIQQHIDALDVGHSDNAQHIRINQHKLNVRKISKN